MKFGLKRETLETEGGREVRFLLVCGRKTQTAVYPSSPRNPPGFLTVLYSWLFLYSVYRWMSDQHRNRRIDTSVNIAEVENCVNKETKFHYNLCCGLFFSVFFFLLHLLVFEPFYCYMGNWSSFSACEGGVDHGRWTSSSHGSLRTKQLFTH